MIRLFMIFSVLLMLAGCGSSSSTSVPAGGSSASGLYTASGALMFSGADTANIGNQVVAGYAAPVAATTSKPAGVVIVDSNSAIVSNVPAINSSGNGFFMTVSDGVSSISGAQILSVTMLVRAGGVDYTYICSITTTSSGSGDCGASTVTLDIANRLVAFVGATMTRYPGNGAPVSITVDGTIRW